MYVLLANHNSAAQTSDKTFVSPNVFCISDMWTRLALARNPLVSEAFSRNPTDGSFAVLAFQLAASTKYLNEVFLSAFWPSRRRDRRSWTAPFAHERHVARRRPAKQAGCFAGSRESIEVRESARGVIGDIPKKGVVRYSLDSCLLLSSFFAWSPPWNYLP